MVDLMDRVYFQRMSSRLYGRYTCLRTPVISVSTKETFWKSWTGMTTKLVAYTRVCMHKTIPKYFSQGWGMMAVGWGECGRPGVGTHGHVYVYETYDNIIQPQPIGLCLRPINLCCVTPHFFLCPMSLFIKKIYFVTSLFINISYLASLFIMIVITSQKFKHNVSNIYIYFVTISPV